MKQRVITGAVMTAALVVALVFSNTIVWPLLCAALSIVGALEISGVYRLRSAWFLVPTLLFAGGLPLFAYMTGREALTWSMGVSPSKFLVYACGATLIYMFAVFFYGIFTGGKDGFTATVAALMMVLYVTFGFLSLVLLRRMSGLPLTILAFVGAWISDTFAYFTGRLLGKHKLCPLVSPKKTVEGSIGGMVFSSLVSLLLGYLLFVFEVIPQPSYIALAVAGILLSLASQAGDLTASLLKREYGVKDYGKLFPGHGGVLDRFDSVIAVSIVLLIFCALTGVSLLGAPVVFTL